MKNELDVREHISGIVTKYTQKIVIKALKQMGVYGSNFDGTKLSAECESVKNYSVKIYTVRYDGRLLVRRFPSDCFGFQYKFESPIFNNLRDE